MDDTKLSPNAAAPDPYRGEVDTLPARCEPAIDRVDGGRELSATQRVEIGAGWPLVDGERAAVDGERGETGVEHWETGAECGPIVVQPAKRAIEPRQMAVD